MQVPKYLIAAWKREFNLAWLARNDLPDKFENRAVMYLHELKIYLEAKCREWAAK